MNKHVVDLETAKKLELPEGFKPYWSWNARGRDASLFVTGGQVVSCGRHYPAPTLDEMLELLPVTVDFHSDKLPHGEDAEIVMERMKTNERLADDSISPYYTLYVICYRSLNYEEEEFSSKVNFATAAAELYICLKDNGHA